MSFWIFKCNGCKQVGTREVRKATLNHVTYTCFHCNYKTRVKYKDQLGLNTAYWGPFSSERETSLTTAGIKKQIHQNNDRDEGFVTYRRK